MTKFRTGAVGSGCDEPVHTITAGGESKRPAGAPHALGIVTSHITKLRGTNIGHTSDEPLHTVSAQGTHFAEVRAFLVKYYGNEQDGIPLNESLHTVTARDRFGLVTVHGEEYAITDIGLRMLAPRELFRAQGFPENYIIDRGLHIDADGNHSWKPLTNSSQVRMCGNSVCPPLAAAIIRANCADMMSIKEEKRRKA
jgi:DNA (cytosine-5)-methyltransferase 1